MSDETETVIEAELQPHEPSPGEVEARNRVRAEAEGMTHHQAASALARALDAVGDAADADTAALAALAEWHRITDLLAGHGGPYTTGADPYAQGQLAARDH
ncbi:hypothetical protein [Streptomyces sp. C]|uniref:hypothetical protein n=1 Tax=Streptomyces sp. C TaxID=253839 RepID=UPI0001B5360E|nr:hypothetical protein [Streptomyces sp. C]EFL12898.1 predicted protein [Streptomyces sp. C]